MLTYISQTVFISQLTSIQHIISFRLTIFLKNLPLKTLRRMFYKKNLIHTLLSKLSVPEWKLSVAIINPPPLPPPPHFRAIHSIFRELTPGLLISVRHGQHGKQTNYPRISQGFSKIERKKNTLYFMLKSDTGTSHLLARHKTCTKP